MNTITREFYQGSTGNVSPATRDWLNEQGRENFQSRNASIYVLVGPYGWWIYADAGWAEEGGDTVPKEIVELMRRARDANCEWLDLDCDNDPVEGMEFYDW